jgi:hypothetical protein
VAADTLARMRRKCPVCGRMVVKRANGKIYRHNRPMLSTLRFLTFDARPMCEGTGRKVGR